MSALIVGAVIVVLCAGALGFFFAPDEFPRGLFAAWAAWAAFCLLIFIGVVAVAAHFAARYW